MEIDSSGDSRRTDARSASREPAAAFGARLRRFREAAHLTQEELAARAGLTAKAVSALERGERKRPYPHTVRSLADALDLSREERAALAGSVHRRDVYAPTTDQSKVTLHSTLPVSLTPLLGREREVDEIVTLLRTSTARLLTLTGPGGIGKTRLGIEAAHRASDGFSDGVAFVALAPLGDAALVMPTVSQALGLRETAGVRPQEVIRQHLHQKTLLLVLDNFEHVAEAAPEVVDLLGSCPNLSVLVTSRAPLRVRGEREYPVSPLAVPDPTRIPEATAVAQTPAARLFVERAEDASPAFRLTRQNAAAVAAICWRLDGLPLALELAAAQMRFLGPTALLSRLDQALQAGGARDLPERQRTMQATLDWSHDLLHEREKELFRRLSVFAGGFTLEAAEEVAAAGAVEAADVLLLLGNLVEQSLVVVETAPEGVTRYRMLEPIRQYALERLRESGEEHEVRQRHVRRYLALAEQAEPHIKGLGQAEWLDRLETENDNLRAAIAWSLESGETHVTTRFGWVLGMYWVMRARHTEGRMWMEQTLARGGDLPREIQARCRWALAACVYGSGDDERLMRISEEGVALARQAGDRHAEGHLLGMIGFAALQLGELDRAARALEEALEIDRERRDDWAAAHILTHLAVVPLRKGDYRRAAAYAEEALAFTQRTGDRLAANIALHILAQAAWASGEQDKAARYFREALELTFEVSDRTNAAYCLQGLAAVAEARGDLRRAARLLGAGDTLLEAAGTHLYAQMDRRLYRHVADSVRERLGEQAWKGARAEGRAMSLEQAVAYVRGGVESPPSAVMRTPAVE